MLREMEGNTRETWWDLIIRCVFMGKLFTLPMTILAHEDDAFG